MCFVVIEKYAMSMLVRASGRSRNDGSATVRQNMPGGINFSSAKQKCCLDALRTNFLKASMFFGYRSQVLCQHGLVCQRLHNIVDHLLCVGKKHHRLVHVKHVVVDAGITDPAHRALDEEHGLGLVHIEHRHAIDRR